MHEPLITVPDPTAPASRRLVTVIWLATSLLLVGTIVGVWLQVDRTSTGAGLAGAALKGERPAAPALPRATIADSGADGLGAWYGGSGGTNDRVLVVNWWASWCGPCIEEAPILVELASEYGDRTAFVAVNAGNEDLESDARAFVRDNDLESLAVVRSTAREQEAWGVRNFPMTFVVGTDGRIASVITGPVERDALAELVDAELERS